MEKVSIDGMTSEEIGEAIDQALKEVAAEYKAGTLDLSGRYEIEPAEPSAVKKPESPVKPEAAA